MGKTSIEWTDHSWPVVNGCRRASPGCGGSSGEGSCYAERLISTRLRHLPKYEGLAEYRNGGPRWTGGTRLWRPDLAMPLTLRKPARIFVADMGDLFYEGVRDEDIDAVFGVMAACQYTKDGFRRHTFQVLTKRAERMRAYLAQDRREQWADAQALISDGGDSLHDQIRFGDEVLPHVHVGVSVENQEWADRRIPVLLDTRAALRWISAEPLLGPIDLMRVRIPRAPAPPFHGHALFAFRGFRNRLDWVVVGSESGPGARPMEPQWARKIVDACGLCEVPVFTKQIATPEGAAAGVRKGGNPAFWPPGVWPRQLPEVRP